MVEEKDIVELLKTRDGKSSLTEIAEGLASARYEYTLPELKYRVRPYPDLI